MKLKTNILIIAFFGLLKISGADYQSIYSDRIAFFENSNHRVKCIRIDSIIYQPDSVFYSYRKIRDLGDYCFSPYGSSWMGMNVRLKQNGENIFLNKENKEILIKTDAGINESWVMFSFSDSSKVVANVVKNQLMNVLGMSDSVKTIHLQVYDSDMVKKNHKINDFTLLLSKNYGWIRTLNFYLFPDYSDDYFNEVLESYELIGLNEPQIGTQNLTWFDVYDFNVGDELHILHEQTSGEIENYYSLTIKSILRYLGRADKPGSVEYEVEHKKTYLKIYEDSTIFEYSHDTIKQVYNENPDFDYLPDEPVVDDFMAYKFDMFNTIRPFKIEPSEYEVIFNAGDGCWAYLVVDGCLSDQKYIKGLGGPYYECFNDFILGSMKNELVYYKKGAETGGDALILTGIQKTISDIYVNVYPNPAHETIKIESDFKELPVSFSFSNINGRDILNFELYSKNQVINLNNINKGIYFFHIKKNGILLYNGKILIQ